MWAGVTCSVGGTPRIEGWAGWKVLGSIERPGAGTQRRPVPVSGHFSGLAARAFGARGGVPGRSLIRGKGPKMAVAGPVTNTQLVGCVVDTCQLSLPGRSHLKLGQREACAGEWQAGAGIGHGWDH